MDRPWPSKPSDEEDKAGLLEEVEAFLAMRKVFHESERGAQKIQMRFDRAYAEAKRRRHEADAALLEILEYHRKRGNKKIVRRIEEELRLNPVAMLFADPPP